jgi:hypothetical protein
MDTIAHKPGNVKLAIRPLYPSERTMLTRPTASPPPATTRRRGCGSFVTKVLVPAGIFEYRFEFDTALDSVA